MKTKFHAMVGKNKHAIHIKRKNHQPTCRRWGMSPSAPPPPPPCGSSRRFGYAAFLAVDPLDPPLVQGPPPPPPPPPRLRTPLRQERDKRASRRGSYIEKNVLLHVRGPGGPRNVFKNGCNKRCILSPKPPNLALLYYSSIVFVCFCFVCLFVCLRPKV